MTTIISLVFVSQVLVGNLCLTPIAYAAGMPVPKSTHMKMVMTPVIPMSPLHCENCVVLQEKSGELQQKGCAGSCFAQAKSTVVSLTSSHSPLMTVTGLPKMIFTSEETVWEFESLATGPPVALHIDTTVLRL